MSPFLRRPATIGVIALALLILGMMALAALKAAWATIKLLLFLALILGLVFVVWRGWKRWRRWKDSPAKVQAPSERSDRRLNDLGQTSSAVADATEVQRSEKSRR